MPEQHQYLSTACLHERHPYCRADVGHDLEGMPFLKRPARCKFCSSPCICPCHRGSKTPTATSRLIGRFRR